MFSEKVIEQLSKNLDAKHVSTRQGSGNFKLSYIEGHHAIREANRIFGFDGWDRDTYELNMVQCEEKNTKNGMRWFVSYTAKSQVIVSGVHRVGVGFGQGIDTDLGQAHESAIKEAETDAMKRALMTFGDPFGLALYDKAQSHVDKPGREEPKPDVDGYKFPLNESLTKKAQKAAKERGVDWADVLATCKVKNAKTPEKVKEILEGLSK